MATYYCFECCFIFDPSINPPTKIKPGTFVCESCAVKTLEKEYKPDEADDWLSIQEGLLGDPNKK